MIFKKLRPALLALTTLLILNACQTQNVTPTTTNTTNNGIGGAVPVAGPVTIDGNCEKKEDDGYYDKINISVDKNLVKSMDWTAKPRGTNCRFELKNFNQISSGEKGDLQSKKDKNCHVYVWQDAHHVTVAVYGCKKICKANDKILPVLLEPKTGACKPRDIRPPSK